MTVFTIKSTANFQPWFSRDVSEHELLSAKVGDVFEVEEPLNAGGVFAETATVISKNDSAIVIRFDLDETDDDGNAVKKDPVFETFSI